MTAYEYVIIGFGKAGKTFASFLASQGIKTCSPVFLYLGSIGTTG